MTGIPVTITNAGTPVTSTVGGTPVVLVGGSAVAITDGLELDVDLDGNPVTATFTVVDGAITEITTA